MKTTQHKVAFLLAALFLCFTARTTTATKNAGGLRLSVPVETPDSVQFSWSGGSADATYSIYRRVHGYDFWERIAMGLIGVSGSIFVLGFTLDQDYDYEIRADQP